MTVLLLLVASLVSSFFFPAAVLAQKQPQGAVRARGLQLVAVHSQRFQDFQEGVMRCEIFGEMKNVGKNPIRFARLSVQLLDEKGETVHQEVIDLLPQIMNPNVPRGEVRPLQPQENAFFSAFTRECPGRWLEGRIMYTIQEILFEKP